MIEQFLVRLHLSLGQTLYYYEPFFKKSKDQQKNYVDASTKNYSQRCILKQQNYRYPIGTT